MMSAPTLKMKGFAGHEPALYILVLLHDVDDLVERFQGLGAPGIGDVRKLPVVHRDHRYLACLL